MATICPLDNRYANKIKDIIEHFDILNFTKYKLFIECEYIKFFCDIIGEECDGVKFDNLHKYFNETGLNNIHKIESRTNHDIQALIQYIKQFTPKPLKRWIHFGLTSQDINSPAMVLMYKDFNKKILHKDISKMVTLLKDLREKTSDKVMISFTHGQPATPTTFGKQMHVFIEKLNHIGHDLFISYTYYTKMGGSNGSLSGLKYCFPDKDWETLMSNFVFKKLGLLRNKQTTQIDNYTNYFKLFQIYERLCYVLINLCQDMWLYIHNDYLQLKAKEGEIGSSAMPHKVNPIHFENAEGNLKIAASLFHTIGSSICLSRLQRDLTDSTILRNVGTA